MNKPTSAETKGAVLARASLKAAAELGLDDPTLAPLLGLPLPKVKEIRAGAGLQENSLAYQNAIKLIQLYQSLVGIVGTDKRYIQAWINAVNDRWNATPMELLKTDNGLSEVARHLESAIQHA